MKLSELLWRSDLKEKFVIQKFLCAFLWCFREELWVDMDKELSDELIQKVLISYKSYVEDKKPLEFILGHVDFFGREFFVNEATLIPRPETEYMINSVSEFISEQWTVNSEQWRKNLLLDIGTGCWVLWISVLLQNPDYFSETVFTDYFENALEIARKNYETLVKNYTWKVSFLHSDLLDFLVHKSPLLFPPFLKGDFSGNVILVANLPYIPEETFEANAADNVKKREPKPAFVGGEDGLDYYRKMFDQLLSLQAKNLTMFLEMMTRQVDILREAFGDRMEFEEVKTFHFNIRIVKAWIK